MRKEGSNTAPFQDDNGTRVGRAHTNDVELLATEANQLV